MEVNRFVRICVWFPHTLCTLKNIEILKPDLGDINKHFIKSALQHIQRWSLITSSHQLLIWTSEIHLSNCDILNMNQRLLEISPTILQAQTIERSLENLLLKSEYEWVSKHISRNNSDNTWRQNSKLCSIAYLRRQGKPLSIIMLRTTYSRSFLA